MKKTALLLAAVAGLASTASAQFTFANFNLNVFNATASMDLSGIAPVANYNTFSITADWSAGGGNPFSSEARAAFGTSGGTNDLFSEAAANTGAGSNGNATTLTWSGSMSTIDGSNFWFNPRQTFSGSDAFWDNVSITIDFVPPVPPMATDLGCFDAGEFDIDTEFSTFDTELALYNSSGDLIANNDDAIGLQSRVVETLAEGTYYIAVGGFISLFSNGFGATGGFFSGDISLQINGATVASDAHASRTVSWYSIKVIPTPASASMLALGGLVATRRRR